MRILLLTHYYDPETGPPQLRWSALVREFTKAGHHVDVVAPPPHYPRGRMLEGHEHIVPGSAETGQHGEIIHRVRFRPTKGTVGSNLTDQLITAVDTVVRVLRERRALDPDVVVATAPGLPTLLAARVVATTLRKPVVMELRDAWPDLLAAVNRWDGQEERRRARVKHLIARGASRFLTRLQLSADCVVTTTASFAEVLQGRGVRHVEVIRNAAHPVPNYEHHEPRDADGELRITYVGTVGRAQGLETAVRALRRVQDARVQVSMRVIGTGAGKAAVHQRAEELGVPVSVHGSQPRTTIHEHYRWADTFLIMLKEWRALTWTVPSKLHEALAMGMHVSGSVGGEAADIINATGAGFATAPGDDEALAKEWIDLAHNLPARPDRERMARWVQENADEERSAQIYLEVLHALAGARR
ncbi:glycosyltransferase family 4 protein [Ornithinicoccus hortensis]|uniref:D-inositol 3-phosphate glycosyltransferase n=1 Tax=Ornithinicoccus hortensis TaxID=82346 RepID=A0A542YLY0_9MICO|nr:glycosyltransferase family 4 protein [Ornithinicoccus hortensis]TQL48964.1 glycosyltransferase involved in cell wall biosynthesis [Ornithinicoccus hortensis]